MPSLLSLHYLYRIAIAPSVLPQSENGTINNTLLILAVSGSIVLVTILCAIAYVAAKKRALDLLFDKFTESQEEWLNNRLSSRAKHLTIQNQLLFELSTQLLNRQKPEQQKLQLIEAIEMARSELKAMLSESDNRIYVHVPADLRLLADIMVFKHLLIQLLQELMQQGPNDIILTASQPHNGASIKLSLKYGEESGDRTGERSLTKPYPIVFNMAFYQMAIASFGGTIEAATTSYKSVNFHLYLAAVIDGASPQSGSLVQHANTPEETNKD